MFRSSCVIEILKGHKTRDYFRYVDDTLLAHNSTYTNINNILNEFSNICSLWKNEQNRDISFLDIIVEKRVNILGHQISLSAYRNPTTTDCIIPQNSCQPEEQKWQQSDNIVSIYTIFHVMKKTAILRNDQFNPNI
jgi:hypothetical protein